MKNVRVSQLNIICLSGDDVHSLKCADLDDVNFLLLVICCIDCDNVDGWAICGHLYEPSSYCNN